MGRADPLSRVRRDCIASTVCQLSASSLLVEIKKNSRTSTAIAQAT
jgi:hypothetical protein